MNQSLGPYIGTGYVKGKGPVEVYATTKANRLDCLTERDELIRVARERVIFTKKDKGNEQATA